MSLKVRCLLCSKILQCTREDTSALLEHIREYHPEVTVLESNEALSHMAPENNNNNNNNNKKAVQIDSDPMVRSPGGDTQRLSKTDYNVQRDCTRRSGRKRLYKTSIEKWRPGIGLIYCPKCGTKHRPLVKSHTEKISTSTVGAACILTCWPFCFFPCLFPSPTKEYLHCPVCDNFLGLYDKDRSCVRPNRQFVDSEQELAPESEKKEEEKPPEEELPVDKKSQKKKAEEDKKKQKEEKKRLEEVEKKRKKLGKKQKTVEEDEFFDANSNGNNVKK
ncbi:hypothetical protein ACFFRR_007470 [Megaselia abdita]